jgi:hypothetical protein
MILEALNESGAKPGQVHVLDSKTCSTVIRAHHLAADAKGRLKKKVL